MSKKIEELRNNLLFKLNAIGDYSTHKEMWDDFYEYEKALSTADVMPSGFTLKQENAIWAIIQHLAKEQFQNPRRVYKRKDVFDLIKAEMDW